MNLTDNNDSWQNKCIIFLLIFDLCGATVPRLKNYHRESISVLGY